MNINNGEMKRSEIMRDQSIQENRYNDLDNSDDQKLKAAINGFTSIFLKMMFKSMRSTLPKNKYINGGFAEDIFTDMMDEKVSELGSDQSTFKNINKIMFEQLNNK